MARAGEGNGKPAAGPDPAAAVAGAVAAARKALASLAGRLPFALTARGRAAARRKGAPGAGGKAARPKAARPAFEPRKLWEAIRKNVPFMIVSSGLLGVLLAALVAAVLAGAPARAPKSVPGTTREGEELVRKWILPPGDPLEARLPMEREAPQAYTPEYAARIALDGAPDLSALSALNDEAVEELYGAAR